MRASRATAPRLSARTAALAALFPGAGHLYAGAWIRGILVFGVLFVVLGFATYALGKYHLSSSKVLSYGLLRQGKLALAVGLPLLVLSMVDAAYLAHRKRRGQTTSVSWQEVRVGLPDFFLAVTFVVAMVDFRATLVPGYALWEGFMFWGPFEMISWMAAPALIAIVLDERRVPGAKAFGIAVLGLGLTGMAYVVSAALAASLALFLIVKVASLLLGKIPAEESSRIGFRILMGFASLVCAGIVGTLVGRALAPSNPGDFDMLAIGMFYFLTLGTLEILAFRHNLRRRIESASGR